MSTCISQGRQQSTYFEHNLLTRVVREFNEAANPCSLFSFQGCRVNINIGNEVRRFNQQLVDFRNIVMRGFHEEPSHNLEIETPKAAPDVTHSRGEHFLHPIARTGSWDDPQSEAVVGAVETIMDKLRRRLRLEAASQRDSHRHSIRKEQSAYG